MTPIKKEHSPILRAVNAPLVASVVLLAVYGSIIVNSAVAGKAAGPGMFKRHLVGIAIGLVPLAIAWLIDYRKFEHWVGPLLAFGALLIISPKIPGFGATAKGATSWLKVPGTSIQLFQPSEPAKLVMIIVMAAVIARYNGKIDNLKDLAKILGVMAVPLGLILLQPDLGTGLVFVAITAGMLLVGGLKPRWFAVLGLAAILAVGGVFWANSVLDRTTGHKLIKQYQMDRLMVFIDPSVDPKGAGYNLEQSKIAIGSGELTGKGLGSGTQGNLNFLPERHTDFIFSVLGEELGFVGALALLGLYLMLLMTAISISTSSRNLFGALIVAGVISMWVFQILENIGMTIGLMPITGIPLPFMSYGATFMVTNMAAVGMLLSVWARRY